MQVFGIFEGGGAKGLAHVGAIAAAQELGVQFVGVAGASAGAIVASLIAVGYNAKALYDPSNRTGLLSGALTESHREQRRHCPSPDRWCRRTAASTPAPMDRRAFRWQLEIAHVTVHPARGTIRVPDTPQDTR